MDWELNEDQRALAGAVSQLVGRHVTPPKDGNVSAVVNQHYSRELDAELADGGYFAVARQEGFGPLEAALLVEEVYRSPSVVEVAASAIVVPALTAEELPRPVAMVRAQDIGRPLRFLDVARTVLVDLGDDVAVLGVKDGEVQATPAIYAYPYGRFRQSPDLSRARRLGQGSGARLRQWWRVAMAVEAGAAMDQALKFTVDYVKNRKQFGRAIGSFQAVQHRLAMAVQMAEATKWLARRAAWSGLDSDASLAALYAQESIGPICYDCHQFNGALGMTLEHPLHFWTFRLRALQGELGGAPAQARSVVESVWNVQAV